MLAISLVNSFIVKWCFPSGKLTLNDVVSTLSPTSLPPRKTTMMKLRGVSLSSFPLPGRTCLHRGCRIISGRFLPFYSRFYYCSPHPSSPPPSVSSSSYCKRRPCQPNHNCRIRGLHRSTDYYRPDDLIVVLSVDFMSVVRYPRSKCPWRSELFPPENVQIPWWERLLDPPLLLYRITHHPPPTYLPSLFLSNRTCRLECFHPLLLEIDFSRWFYQGNFWCVCVVCLQISLLYILSFCVLNHIFTSSFLGEGGIGRGVKWLTMKKGRSLLS